MTSPATKLRKPLHAKNGVDSSCSNGSKSRQPNASIFDVKAGSPPVLVPESPLINFLSQLSFDQRKGIQNVRLTESLGYAANHVFSDADELYLWLSPGERLISNFAWPAEQYRKKWFRVDLPAPFVLKFAESVTDADALKHLVGRAHL